MMLYESYRYLFPPRPETKIPRTMLGFYERRGFIAQKKKNGTCCVIFACGNKVIFKNRHNEDHKLWTPKPEHVEAFAGKQKWNVFVGELLHSKVAGGPKNELYLFDKLVHDGVQLVGVTLDERYELLRSSFSPGVDEADQFRDTTNVCVAKNFRSGFDSLFDHLKKEDEGLVLKSPTSRLKSCLSPSANSASQVKCRIAHANYSF